MHSKCARAFFALRLSDFAQTAFVHGLKKTLTSSFHIYTLIKVEPIENETNFNFKNKNTINTVFKTKYGLYNHYKQIKYKI